MTSKELGALGEKIAADFLKSKGYAILEQNFSNRFVSGPQRGEIDIIAKKSGIITFVEVKTLIQENRGRASVASPEEKVDWLKQRKIIKTAESWLMKNKIPLDSKWQIDVVSIKIDKDKKKAKIQHFQNAVF